jgi:lipid-A-disaccharide synthase
MSRPHTYYLVAGEASGDLHGANLIAAIKKLDPEAHIRCWGGDLMQQAGGELVSHYRERAFMGLWEVIKNIRTIGRFLKQAEKDILNTKPNVLVLIDNPGFNMRLAKFAHRAGIPVHYYIAPKVWAWNTGRVKAIRENVDKLYSILPFEPEFFKKHGVDAEYVGNPVLDEIALKKQILSTKSQYCDGVKNIALLPGSRANEISNAMPIMMELAALKPEWKFSVAMAPSFGRDFYSRFALPENMQLCEGKTYEVLAQSDAAVVTSGTATLETALLKVPQVVCYRVAALTYWIGKRVIKVPYISLVNLILNKPTVPELIQGDFNAAKIAAHLESLLEGPQREQQLRDYEQLETLLGEAGASERVAEKVVRSVRDGKEG